MFAGQARHDKTYISHAPSERIERAHQYIAQGALRASRDGACPNGGRSVAFPTSPSATSARRSPAGRRAGRRGATIPPVPLFDYDLVSTRATYRNYVPREFSALLSLVEARAAALKADPGAAREAAALTVAEFTRHKGRGTILLIEVGQDTVGYCIITQGWSHRLAGAVLCIEELHVEPGHDRLVLAEDLLGLLAQVAPGGAVAIRLGPGAADRRLQSLAARLGFHREADPGMIRDMRRQTP